MNFSKKTILLIGALVLLLLAGYFGGRYGQIRLGREGKGEGLIADESGGKGKGEEEINKEVRVRIGPVYVKGKLIEGVKRLRLDNVKVEKLEVDKENLEASLDLSYQVGTGVHSLRVVAVGMFGISAKGEKGGAVLVEDIKERIKVGDRLDVTMLFVLKEPDKSIGTLIGELSPSGDVEPEEARRRELMWQSLGKIRLTQEEVRKRLKQLEVNFSKEEALVGTIFIKSGK